MRIAETSPNWRLGKCRMRQSSPLSSERNKSEFLPPASRTRESLGSTAIAVAVPPHGPTTRHASIPGTFAGKAAGAGSEPDTGAANQLIEHNATAAAAGEFLQVECIRSNVSRATGRKCFYSDCPKQDSNSIVADSAS